MGDVLRWWKNRWSRMAGLVAAGTIFAWMSVGLWRSELHFHGVMNEFRRSNNNQEAASQTTLAQDRIQREQFHTIESHLRKQDRDSADRRAEQRALMRLLEQIFEKTGKSTSL